MDIPDIHKAVRQGDVTLVARLLKDDPSTVHSRDDLKWTPLHRAAAQGDDTQLAHRQIAELLLNAGADVNARDVAGQTPLHLIAMNGSVASVPVAELILARGADVKAESNSGLDCHVYWQHGREIRDLLLSYSRRAT